MTSKRTKAMIQADYDSALNTIMDLEIQLEQEQEMNAHLRGYVKYYEDRWFVRFWNKLVGRTNLTRPKNE